ncbi:unnamed protein product [Dicrocoelium dendriticum]|nr:unnamed protein product [Dicrocoelium dendriticum]
MYGAAASGKKRHDLLKIELTSPNLHAKPISIRKLVNQTHFTRNEIQTIYQAFKNMCPSGYATKDTFVQVYRSFFPGRAPASYAQLCFRVFDKAKSGKLSFEQFARMLSQITRGTDHEKIDWVFRLYDLDGDGYISRLELTEVATAIFDLIRSRADGLKSTQIIEARVEATMQTFDLDKDGRISRDEFFATSFSDSRILANLNIFGGYP